MLLLLFVGACGGWTWNFTYLQTAGNILNRSLFILERLHVFLMAYKYGYVTAGGAQTPGWIKFRLKPKV